MKIHGLIASSPLGVDRWRPTAECECDRRTRIRHEFGGPRLASIGYRERQRVSVESENSQGADVGQIDMQRVGSGVDDEMRLREKRLIEWLLRQIGSHDILL